MPNTEKVDGIDESPNDAIKEIEGHSSNALLLLFSEESDQPGPETGYPDPIGREIKGKRESQRPAVHLGRCN